MTAGRTACQPVLLTPSAFTGGQLALSSDSVYVLDYGMGGVNERVLRFSKATGQGVVLSGITGRVLNIASDNRFLYWTTQPADPAQGLVSRANLDGTGVTTIATNQPGAAAILADSSGVYWVTGLATNGAADSAIMRLGASDPSPFTFVGNQLRINSIASDANNIYWFTVAVQPDGSDSFVAARSKSQGPVITIATRQPNATGTGMSIAAFGNTVYWAPRGLGSNDGQVLSAPPANGATARTYATARERPIAVVSDGNFVYWTVLGNGTDGLVERSAVGPVAPVAIAANLANPLSIGLDGAVVYFTSLGNSTTGAPGGLYRLVP